jgi:hypoxia up-regulated 1
LTTRPALSQNANDIRLAAFDKSDSDRVLREDTRNNLESFAYKARDLLEDASFVEATTEILRKEIENTASEINEWIYGDGADADTEGLKEKLSGLKKLVNPVLKRKEEASKRPSMIQSLKDSLDTTETAVKQIKEQAESMRSSSSAAEASSSSAAEAAKSASTETTESAETTETASSSTADEFLDLDDEPSTSSTSTKSKTTSKAPKPVPTVSPEDIDEVVGSIEDVRTWLSKKIAEQEKLAPSDDPVLLTADIEAKLKALNQSVMTLLRKNQGGGYQQYDGNGYGGYGGSKTSSSTKSKATKKPKPSRKKKGSKATGEEAASEAADGHAPVFTVKPGENGEAPDIESLLSSVRSQEARLKKFKTKKDDIKEPKPTRSVAVEDEIKDEL